MYSFCASMITRVEFSTVALEGLTPTSSRKDFADIFGLVGGVLVWCNIKSWGEYLCTKFLMEGKQRQYVLDAFHKLIGTTEGCSGKY
jgi:hypothetical protein